LTPGEALFVLGANGSDKSRLLHHLYRQNHTNTDRISAHRQTFLNTSAVELAPSHRTTTEGNLRNWDQNVSLRKGRGVASSAACLHFALVSLNPLRAAAVLRSCLQRKQGSWLGDKSVWVPAGLT
jgi:ABC-type hemin transport system ATPase subunit